MMLSNKFLVIVTNLNQIETLKKASITNFLFPLHGFSVGFPETLSLNNIQEENSYIYINRLLDTDAYLELKELLSNLNSNIKGIVFEDFGVLQIAKELELKQTLILYQNHFGTNYESINANLEFVDSVVISTDITKEEIGEILKNTNKPLVHFSYGLVSMMYSRRTLLSNYESEFDLKKQSILTLQETIAKQNSIAVENEFGTVIYHGKYLNALEIQDENKILFYLFNTLFMTNEDLENLFSSIKENKSFEMPQQDDGFLNKKTIYRLGEKS